MKTVICYKVTYDERDMVTGADRLASFEKAAPKIGDYDLNAIEAGVQLAADTGGEALCLSVGGQLLTDTKTRKSLLSRGGSANVVVVDDNLVDADSTVTAKALAAAITKIGDVDVVVCGEGSADEYSQQVAAQVAALLGVPYVNGVSAISAVGGGLNLERTLEDEIEWVETTGPVVVSVMADSNSPRIPSMKDILGAGKKSTIEWAATDIGVDTTAAASLGPERVPEQAARDKRVFEAGQADQFFTLVRELI